MKNNLIINHSEIIYVRVLKDCDSIEIGFKNGSEKIFSFTDKESAANCFKKLEKKLEIK